MRPTYTVLACIFVIPGLRTQVVVADADTTCTHPLQIRRIGLRCYQSLEMPIDPLKNSDLRAADLMGPDRMPNSAPEHHGSGQGACACCPFLNDHAIG